MDKEALIDYAQNLGNLMDEISTLKTKIDGLDGQLKLATNANKLLKEHNTKIESRVTVSEKELARTAQYGLNRQLELHRVPDDISKDDLCGKVCEMLSLTGVTVTQAEVDKCHRLKKQSSVVVEFKCRDTRDPILFARKSLKDKKTDLENIGMQDVIVTESLCTSFKRLDFLCRKLKKRKDIHDTWFFHGKLFIILNGETEKRQIAHFNDLLLFFDEELLQSFITPQ